jgi:hypothetical protein
MSGGRSRVTDSHCFLVELGLPPLPLSQGKERGSKQTVPLPESACLASGYFCQTQCAWILATQGARPRALGFQTHPYHVE